MLITKDTPAEDIAKLLIELDLDEVVIMEIESAWNEQNPMNIGAVVNDPVFASKEAA